METQELSGWGRYPRKQCHVSRPDSRAALQRALALAGQRPILARGLGRSYGDSSLLSTGIVLDQTGRNRILKFDAEAGLLECEAGVTLADIIDVFTPRGWFLPTTPGTKFVTVGGAIAADVHGKNHHVDGSFGEWVPWLRLLLVSGEITECSPTRTPELFWATVGGMGLTGIIESAAVQLVRIETTYCTQELRRTRDLDETFSVFLREDSTHRHSVAWVDCLATGRSLGRSAVMLANDCKVDDLPKRLRSDPLRLRRRARFTVRPPPPVSLVGRWSAKAFNSLYYATRRDGKTLVEYDTFFYPLDRIRGWNLLYGPRGFVQCQVLFPEDQARKGLKALLEYVSSRRAASFLAVLKRSGRASGGMLSFMAPGYTLAVDIPHPGARLGLMAREIEEVVLRYSGRVYLAKDSISSSEAIALMYPKLDRFRRVKRLVDPSSRLRSEQALRLGIVES
ncbi:MAG: FAD-binding oxidoreductase [Gemmatimonadota bacterium]|jgi:FAD/FMN-containing dehydrogenase